MGTLERKLDLDAIARVKSGVRFKPEPMKRQSEPRPASSYRAAKRAALRAGGEAGYHDSFDLAALKRVHHPPVRPNRRDRDAIRERQAKKAKPMPAILVALFRRIGL